MKFEIIGVIFSQLMLADSMRGWGMLGFKTVLKKLHVQLFCTMYMHVGAPIPVSLFNNYITVAEYIHYKTYLQHNIKSTFTLLNYEFVKKQY